MQQSKDKGPKQSPDEREKQDWDAALARWRKIERVVKGRYLHGAEFQTAADAWKELCSVISRVETAKKRTTRNFMRAIEAKTGHEFQQ